MIPRHLLGCWLLAISLCAHSEVILSTASPRVEAGSAIELRMTIANDGSSPLQVDIPAPVHLRFETDTALATLDAMPDRTGVLEIAPNGFVFVRLRATIPSEITGSAVLTTTGFVANPVALNIAPATTQPSSARAAETGSRDESKTATTLVDKPPPLALSVYEPVYFIVGGDDGLNAKFQISFRYRLFDGEGRLARKLPWIDDLYLAYSQTSLWDLDELSKPFRDSSYRPRLFYANHDLGRLFDGRLRLGVEAGAGHESNGKDGEQSRSYNMFYVRPTLTFGDPDGFNVYFAPLIHNYVAESENPDIADYRGYVDWLMGAGSKGGLNFWAQLRKGRRSSFGSVELNLSYPLSKLSGGDLTGWLLLQYFGGHGESLLDYDRKLDSQVRLGVAVAL